MAGVHRDTLLRWLRERSVPEPGRNRHGWRVFTVGEAAAIAAFAKGDEPDAAPETPRDDEAALSRLLKIEWDFAYAKTGYLTHSLHPYPAKFIPQIPNALIQELSSVGETIADIFCGGVARPRGRSRSPCRWRRHDGFDLLGRPCERCRRATWRTGVLALGRRRRGWSDDATPGRSDLGHCAQRSGGRGAAEDRAHAGAFDVAEQTVPALRHARAARISGQVLPATRARADEHRAVAGGRRRSRPDVRQRHHAGGGPVVGTQELRPRHESAIGFRHRREMPGAGVEAGGADDGLRESSGRTRSAGATGRGAGEVRYAGG